MSRLNIYMNDLDLIPNTAKGGKNEGKEKGEERRGMEGEGRGGEEKKED